MTNQGGDRKGPVEFLTGEGTDIRSHRPIGLNMVTCLLKGQIHHRDNLGTDQWVAPGAVNLMAAGHGITHSERADGAYRQRPKSLFGLQTWMALPASHDDAESNFEHVAKADLPLIEAEGKEVRFVLGEAFGERLSARIPAACVMPMQCCRPGPPPLCPTSTRTGARV
ncbi:pirin family protein [Jannaschia seohaensis]|uniref:Pirin N-terminal domain-containing protein n=1 Tax=Jannaschia seohaensis TaxID=475081 RepID=A0A2Y9B3Y4_9RHOB|nr:hypothetical protein BCF38_11740 [Jannaschia seohaensis]SSA51210.1 hypothetical protein SAMN05421539_11740 [Jannaschia seohaensis]